MTRSRLRSATGTNFIESLEDYGKSTQWITLWAADAYRLLRDRERIKEAWARRSGGDGRKRAWRDLSWIAPNKTLSGAYDEVVFVHEARARNMAIRNETLTYVKWNRKEMVVAGARVAPEEPAWGGHPDAWHTDNPENIQPFLNDALAKKHHFFRKVNKGALPFFIRHLDYLYQNPQATQLLHASYLSSSS